MNASTLEREFSERLHDAIRISHDLGYHPNRFEQKLNEHGALSVSRKLIKSGELQDGLKVLAKLGRKDLSMESIMLIRNLGHFFPSVKFRPLSGGSVRCSY